MEAEIESIDADGLIHFTMLNTIKRYICDGYKPGDEVICSLGKFMKKGFHRTPVPALTADGESVSLGGYCDDDLKLGDIVKAEYHNEASGTFHLYCTVKERASGSPVNIATAFHNLMLLFAYDDEEEEENRRKRRKRKYPLKAMTLRAVTEYSTSCMLKRLYACSTAWRLPTTIMYARTITWPLHAPCAG